MVRSSSSKQIDRSQAERYRRVGVSLLASAQALEAVAVEGDPYGNAVGVVAIHSAIAYNDALTLAFRGIKSTEGDHRKAADVLQRAMGSRAVPEQVDRGCARSSRSRTGSRTAVSITRSTRLASCCGARRLLGSGRSRCIRSVLNG